MTQCKNCGGTFDDSVKYCPQCGAVLKQDTSNNNPYGGGPFANVGANTGSSYSSNNAENYGGPFANNSTGSYGGPYGGSQNTNTNPYGAQNQSPYGSQNVSTPYGSANNIYTSNLGTSPKTSKLPMKWYNFLIYFALFAGAVLNFINGIMYLTGSIWSSQGTSAETVYRIYDNLSLYDKVFGIALIAIAALQIYTRFALAGYKANAPQLLYGVYGASAVLTVGYNLLALNTIKSALEGILSSAQIALMIDDIGTQIGINIAVNCFMIAFNMNYFGKRKSMFHN